MESQSIVKEVWDYIHTNILLGVSDGPLDPDASFLQHGILNSTGVLELVGFLEEHYGLRCGDAEITPDNLDSLNRVAAFVERKLNP
jgi:acyl carrier protein